MRALVVLSGSTVAPSDWSTDRFRALGTTVDLVVCGLPAGAGAAVRELVARCDRSWSRFRPDSDLTRLNADPRPEVELPSLLRVALQRALVAWEATDGWFDPTVLDALESAGYDRSFELLDPRPCDPAVGVPVPGPHGVVVSGSTVRRPPGVRFDLGGVGKGLAADLVVERLLDRGATSVCVSVGGDVRVGGTPPDGGWAVPVDDAHRVGTAFVARLVGGGIATSSTAVRRWPTRDGGWSHHLIDPRTGAPAHSGVVSVVVAAAEAWWAEVLAKAALVAGATVGSSLLGRHGAEGWIGTEDGRVVEVCPGHR